MHVISFHQLYMLHAAINRHNTFIWKMMYLIINLIVRDNGASSKINILREWTKAERKLRITEDKDGLWNTSVIMIIPRKLCKEMENLLAQPNFS